MIFKGFANIDVHSDILLTQYAFHTPSCQRLGPFYSVQGLNYIVYDWGNLPQVIGSYRDVGVGCLDC